MTFFVCVMAATADCAFFAMGAAAIALSSKTKKSKSFFRFFLHI